MEKEQKKQLAKFGKTLTDREIEMVQNQRAHQEVFAKDERASKLAVINEDGYKKFKQFKLMANISLHKALSAKSDIDKIKVDIEKGTTERKFQDGTLMSIKDLKVLMLSIDNSLYGYMSDLANHCLGIYARIGAINPVSKQAFFTKEDWDRYITSMEATLKEYGLDLYKG